MLNQENNHVLRPITDPWIDIFLKNKKDIRALLINYGSPLNVHHSIPFLNNLSNFENIFRKFKLRHHLLFPTSASKCKKFIELSANIGLGTATSSIEEIQECLKKKMDPTQITVLSSQNKRLLHFAVQNNIRIILGHFEEGNLIQSICENLDKKAKIGFKLGGFIFEGLPIASKNGISPDKAVDLLTDRLSKKWTHLDFDGFHFHIEEFCVMRKAEALKQTIVLVDLLSRKGIKTNYIDIGGSIPINYLKNRKEWGKYNQAIKNSSQIKKPDFKIEDNVFNTHWPELVENKQLKLFPLFNKFPKELFVEKLLMQPFSSHELLFQAIRSRGLKFVLQPGRALLDQTGISLVRISEITLNQFNNLVIRLDMTAEQLQKIKVDYIMDPLFVCRDENSNIGKYEAYLIDSDVENPDLIIKRKIHLQKKPEVGDIICFVNTAGYGIHLHNYHLNSNDPVPNIFINEEENQYQYEMVAS